VVLFGVLVWRVGAVSIGHLLLSVGWWAVLLPLPQGLIMLCDTLGWWFAFSRTGCPLRYGELLRFTVAAKAINQVTPSLSQAGELVKLHLLRRAGVPSDLATASVVTAKTTIVTAELAFIILGFAVPLSSMAIDPTVTALGVIGAGLLAFALGGILTWLRLGLFRPLVWLGLRVTVLRAFFDRHGALFASTDAMLREYLVLHRSQFWISGLAFFAGWLGGALEVWVLLWIMGLPAHATAALLIQATLTVVSRLTAFVPANLGTHEAGTLMIFTVTGLSGEAALAFALLRRARQIVWVATGLALFPGGGRRHTMSLSVKTSDS
jgi:hypothetical protein